MKLQTVTALLVGLLALGIALNWERKQPMAVGAQRPWHRMDSGAMEAEFAPDLHHSPPGPTDGQPVSPSRASCPENIPNFDIAPGTNPTGNRKARFGSGVLGMHPETGKRKRNAASLRREAGHGVPQSADALSSAVPDFGRTNKHSARSVRGSHPNASESRSHLANERMPVMPAALFETESDFTDPAINAYLDQLASVFASTMENSGLDPASVEYLRLWNLQQLIADTRFKARYGGANWMKLQLASRFQSTPAPLTD